VGRPRLGSTCWVRQKRGARLTVPKGLARS
jgi:hypothetical protein